MDRQNWLDTATAEIRFGPDRKAVRQELEDHLEDAKERRTAAGASEDEAEAAALQAMGDPWAIAEELGRLHRPWLGYLWRASQGLLLAAIGICLVLCVMQAFRDSTQTPQGHLPGWEIYDYLTWQFETTAGGMEEYPLTPNGSFAAGGYQIQVEQALMRRQRGPSQEEPWWNLRLLLHIDTGWRCEALYWGPNVIAEVRDNAGNVYGGSGHDPDKFYYSGSSSAAPFLGQKAGLELNSVPEDIEWIELDIGYGRFMQTMHVDIQKEAGT